VSASLLFLIVAGAAGFGLVRTIRGQARTRKYLEGRADDAPLQISHLTRALQDWARETRALRLSYDSPRREIEGAVGPLGEDLDARLTMASRELGEWLGVAEHLAEEDKETLRDLGATPDRVRNIFAELGWSLERRQGRRKLLAQIREIVRELDRIEERLQVETDPYR
jgi:hypothetical protein